MTKSRLILQIVRWLVGLSILGYLIYVVDPYSIAKVLSRINLVYIPLWVCVYMVSTALGALNIHLLLRPFSTVRYLSLLRYDIVATSLGYFTPAQMGTPIALALNLKKEDGVLLSRSVSALLIDKLNTFVVASVLAAIGILHVFGSSNIRFVLGEASAKQSYLITSALAVVGVLVLLVLYRKSARVRKITADVLAALGSYRRHSKYVAMNLLVTILVQCCLALLWSITFLTIGSVIDFSLLLITVPAIGLVGYLPVTVAGIGTQELSAMVLWKSAGVSGDLGISLFLVSRALTLLVSIILLMLNVRGWPFRKYLS